MSEPTKGPSKAAASEIRAPAAPPAEPAPAPAASAVPTTHPYAWAAQKHIDPALVAGAAVLAGWPAGNLKEGSLLVTEADFDAALKAFHSMEIG